MDVLGNVRVQHGFERFGALGVHVASHFAKSLLWYQSLYEIAAAGTRLRTQLCVLATLAFS